MDFRLLLHFFLIFQEEDIQTEIMINGPVQATLRVHEDFYMYKSGVYQHTQLGATKGPNHIKSGYHSVRILGNFFIPSEFFLLPFNLFFRLGRRKRKWSTGEILGKKMNKILNPPPQLPSFGVSLKFRWDGRLE